MRAVTIISDFGIQDHYAGLLKAAILTQHSQLHLIDITHQVDTHDIRQAGYILRTISKKFPAQSVHVVAVNNYYNSPFEVICFEYKDQFYIGPNNGVFSLAFDSIDESQVYKIHFDEEDQDFFQLVAHGVGLICKGMSITEVGPPLNMLEKKLDVQPVITDSEIRATIIHVDKFENVILNVTKEYFEYQCRGRQFEIFFKYENPITRISDNYADVSVGDVLCFFNSGGYMELAINMGKAASQLDLIKDETIQIKFS